MAPINVGGYGISIPFQQGVTPVYEAGILHDVGEWLTSLKRTGMQMRGGWNQMQFSLSINFCRVRYQFTAFFFVLFIGLPRIFAESQIPLIDPTFQPNLPAEGNGQVNDILLQADGSIVIGGSFESISDKPIGGIARLFRDGKLDENFGTGADSGVLGLAQQTDGKIVVSGYFTELQGVTRYGLGRLLANGEVDTNFNAGLLFANNNTPYKLAIRPDGRILVSTLNGGLFQVTTNGTLDSTFVQTNAFQGYWIHSLFLETNGSVLAGGGFTSVNGFVSSGLVQLDSSGKVNTNFQTGLASSSDVFTILQQTNGGFLIGGMLLHTDGTANTVLQRLDSQLNWDPSFQTSQFTAYNVQTGPFIRSAILQPDGKIVVGGNFEDVGGYYRRHLVRLDSSGHVDTCFDTGIGMLSYWGVNIVKMEPDGRILAGGAFGAPGLIPNELARLLPQGDCNAVRVYIGNQDPGYYVIGSWPPGGTNHVQTSTNLIDWEDLAVETGPSVFISVDITDSPAAFFRVKREQ